MSVAASAWTSAVLTLLHAQSSCRPLQIEGGTGCKCRSFMLAMNRSNKLENESQAGKPSCAGCLHGNCCRRGAAQLSRQYKMQDIVPPRLAQLASQLVAEYVYMRHPALRRVQARQHKAELGAATAGAASTAAPAALRHATLLNV